MQALVGSTNTIDENKETLVELQQLLAACENSSQSDPTASKEGGGGAVGKQLIAALKIGMGKRKQSKPAPETLIVFMLVLWQHLLGKVRRVRVCVA